MDLVLIPMMLARPHVLAWPLLALWTWLMLRARERDRAPPLAAALADGVWANLHGSFVFGLAIAAAFGLEALVAAPDKDARAAPVAAVRARLRARRVRQRQRARGRRSTRCASPSSQMLPLIDEWKPSSPTVTPFFFGVLAAGLGADRVEAAAAAPGALGCCWRRCSALALLQVRHQAMLAIVAAMILPAGFAQASASRAAPR